MREEETEIGSGVSLVQALNSACLLLYHVTMKNTMVLKGPQAAKT